MKMIAVNTPVLNGNERKYLMDCLDTGWISSAGPYIEKFESGMAKLVGHKYGAAVSNGTTALEAAVLALKIEKGSEVILPDFTIISCVQAIVKAGLIPVPVDCNRDTWNMDVTKVEEVITEKTRAIMVVHIYGLPVDMQPIWELAKKHDLIIVEDAAEAHGLTYYGRQCGGLGDVSTFSFFPNKHITCGEGGMVLTSDDFIFSRVKKIRNLFFDQERKYIHDEFGSNFRMTNMQAAIGLAQLERIKETVLIKRKIGRFYQEELSGIELFQLPVPKTDYAENIYWVFGIVIRDPGISADLVMQKLGEKGIQTRHFFYPMHKQPALIKEGCCSETVLDDSKFFNSNYISDHGFYIPSGVGLLYEDMKYIVSVMTDLFG